MANYNKCILAGFLTRDPELRYTPKGTAVAKFALAINRTWKSESGESKEEVTFIDVDAFGKTAETIGQYLRKGMPLLMEGRLKLSQWQDKQSNQPRQKLSVILETFQFLGSKQEGGGTAAAPGQRAAAGEVAQPDGADATDPDAQDNDVPF